MTPRAPQIAYDATLDPNVFADVSDPPAEPFTPATPPPPRPPAALFAIAPPPRPQPAKTIEQPTHAPGLRCVLCRKHIDPTRSPVVRLAHGPAHAACSAAQQEKVEQLFAAAEAEGTHGPPRSNGVCDGCDEECLVYHEIGVGGGSGVAGRVKLCKACTLKRGIK